MSLMLNIWHENSSEQDFVYLIDGQILDYSLPAYFQP